MRTLRRKRSKMNNSGLTLLEILVTIAVLGIVSIPLISNFMVGMRTNLEARKTQDATQTAQNVAEAFKTTDLNQLLPKMNGTAEVSVGLFTFVSSNTGGTLDSAGNCEGYNLQLSSYQKTIVTMPQAYIEGDGNEKYVVDVELRGTNGKSNLPDITDIGEGSANTLRIEDEYYLYDGANAAAGSKKTDINIQCKHSDTKAGEYVYSVDMDILYGTDKKEDVYVRTGKSVSKALGNEINLYIFCNYYDMTSALSSDVININYDYDANGYGDADDEYTCNVYLIAQNQIVKDGHSVALNPNNIHINKTARDSKNPYKTLTAKGLKVYSNTEGAAGVEKKTITKPDGTTAEKNLTVAEKSVYAVYDLNVKVYECDASGKKTSNAPVARVNTTITR